MRVYLTPDAWEQTSVTLSREETHYAQRVLRSEPGDEVNLFDGAGRTGRGQVTGIGHHAMTIDLLEQTTAPRPLPHVHLAQALPKGKKMDWIIEKVTELGVARIIPMQTRHAVMQAEGVRAERKVARWQEIAKSATRQSGQAWMPLIEPVTRMRDLLDPASSRAGKILLCSLAAGARDLKQVLSATELVADGRLLLLVGPEGDFSLGETQAALEAGALPVCLGSSVLRTETAAIYTVAAIRYEFG